MKKVVGQMLETTHQEPTEDNMEEKEKRRIKFRRTWDRKPIEHVKDRPRYNRTNDKLELQDEVEEYYEEKKNG